MSESKFLKYQDRNMDKIHDDCPVMPYTPQEVNCLDCSPNPKAIIPDWTKRSINECFLNEKSCEYWITAEDPDRTTTADGLDTIYDDNRERAIKELLMALDKDDSDETIEKLVPVTINRDWTLSTRQFSHVKVLFAIPFDELKNIPPKEDEPEEEEEEDPEDIKIVYDASEIKLFNIRVRKGLSLYSRYFKVFQKLEGGNLKFLDDNRVFDLDQYGDLGIWRQANTGALMGTMLTALDSWLNTKGYNLEGIGSAFSIFTSDFWTNEGIVKIEFSFSGKDKYKLKRMKVYGETCPNKPRWFKKSACKDLMRYDGWNDMTARHYWARMGQMEAELTARGPRPWLEFIQDYTYPKIYSTTNPAYTNTETEATVGSCITDALADEVKELGENIMDDVFTIGDAIAYRFHKNVCTFEKGDQIDKMKRMNLIYDPEKGEHSTLGAMAVEQAMKEIETGGNHFAMLCASFFGSKISLFGSPLTQMDDLWKDGFNKLKWCGLFDLLMEAIQCLMSGLSLEEALSAMVKAALESMDISNFGDMFVGLPPEKQAELDALVRKKLEDGEMFNPGSSGRRVSDDLDYEKGGSAGDGQTPLYGSIRIIKPWEKDHPSQKQKRMDSFGGRTSANSEYSKDQPQNHETRTLMSELDPMNNDDVSSLSEQTIMSAYFKALLEVYSDNILELVDELNKFPGAPVIAWIIATLDCPRPPIFNPGLFDFLTDLELPFCRNMNEIIGPRFENPFKYWPKLTDIMALIWELLKWAIQQIILAVMMRLLVFICELIGDAICKALEMVGDIVASLPELVSGRTSFAQVIKESICGPDADDQAIDDTIVDLVASLGVGGAAFGNRDKVLSFTEDLSSATTNREMVEWFEGDPSQTFLEIANSLLDYEYPEFREALPHGAAISSLGRGVGNLMPADFKSAMRDALNDPDPENRLSMPANPTLCATPEQLEDFNNLRCELLEGRVTPEECQELLDKTRNKYLDDLQGVSSILQDGIPTFIEKQLPPMVSDPGCDNGLIPFESDEIIDAVNSAAGSGFDQLRVDFSTDMLGNGGFWNADSSWGFINMIMADTMGNPLSAHQRYVFSKDDYVDFYTDVPDMGTDDDNKIIESSNFRKQYGAYPLYVAEWLRDDLEGKTFSYECNNDKQGSKKYRWSYDQLGMDGGLFGSNDVDFWRLPNLGYNIDARNDPSNEKVIFTKHERQKTPDCKLRFRNNNQGERSNYNTGWSYGFDVSFYVSDLTSSFQGVLTSREGAAIEEYETQEVTTNIRSDNTRVSITDLYNPAYEGSAAVSQGKEEKEDDEKEDGDGDEDNKIIKDFRYAWLSVDEGLNEIEVGDFPLFEQSFSNLGSVTPPAVLLGEIMTIPAGEAKGMIEAFMEEAFTLVADEVVSNDPAWNYGAAMDDLDMADTMYVIPRGASTRQGGGELYYEAEIWDDDDEEYRGLTNSDGILGVSYDQYKNENRPEKVRVIYLDPNSYGGSYMSPKFHIKPVPNKGWSGMIDVLFPELSPCKPQRTDVIDFGDITAKVQASYPLQEEDKRLQYPEGCSKELPYDRILMRPSKSAIEGLIMTACRMWGSVHLLKAMSIYTKFYPSFPENYSNIVAGYIVETMEAAFKDSQSAFWEFFNSFKDEEFWYSFLEQSVQIYARKWESGGLEKEPPQHVQDALWRINEMQDRYKWPDRDELKRAKENDMAGELQGLDGYRWDKNLEAVAATADSAKLVLSEWVKDELDFMGKKLVENLKELDMTPDYYDLDYYYMTNIAGGNTLSLGGSLKEEPVGLPTEGDGHYTHGGEFADLDNSEEYIGYYHVHTDEEGYLIYMAGEEHMDTGGEDVVGAVDIETGDTVSQALLRPMATKTEIGWYKQTEVEDEENPLGDWMPLGDVPDYNTGPTYAGRGLDGLLTIEKYIKINGIKKSAAAAVTELTNHSRKEDLISEVYPGTLRLVYEPSIDPENESGFTDRVVGLDGELGVRYGLEVKIQGKRYMNVEIDALDYPLRSFAPFEGSSTTLLCLLTKIKEHKKWKILTNYVFPLKKVLAMTAIYIDLGFMPSIGEVTALDGNKKWSWFPWSGPNSTDWGGSLAALGSKPGMYAEYKNLEWKTFPDGDLELPMMDFDIDGLGGWYSRDDREPPWYGGWWVKEWDNWDQILLRNSKSRLKKTFKQHYSARDFDLADDSVSGGSIFLQGMKESLRRRPGAGMFSWWKERKRVSNPFDANGKLCKK